MTPLLHHLAVLGLIAGLAGCSTPRIAGANNEARLPTERFDVKPTAQPEEIRLAVHAQGVSAPQAAALAALVARWTDLEAGRITIRSPTQGVDAAAAYRMGESVRGLLAQQGVPADQIDLVGYDPSGESNPPMRVGFTRYQAEIPKCGTTWTNISRSMQNEVQPNFGCAISANIAAQVANPADLAGPRAMTPQDATRRQVVLDKYRKGDMTGAAIDDHASGAVSKAIN
jgi:pilus assembly protein CpaD